MVSLLAGQVTRAVGVKRERDTGERAERLALLGHSVGALLHDMRTPLSAVGGYAELMATEDDPGLRLEYVGRIDRALDHMETMAHEVLAFARGQREILVSKVYLNLFVKAVREMLLIETERAGMQLLVEVSYDGLGRFDESKIKRVLFNLARNACQAMQPGGSSSCGSSASKSAWCSSARTMVRAFRGRWKASSSNLSRVTAGTTVPDWVWRWRRRSSRLTAARSSAGRSRTRA
jgi:signal transduction histidine kinase